MHEARPGLPSRSSCLEHDVAKAIMGKDSALYRPMAFDGIDPADGRIYTSVSNINLDEIGFAARSS